MKKFPTTYEIAENVLNVMQYSIGYKKGIDKEQLFFMVFKDSINSFAELERYYLKDKLNKAISLVRRKTKCQVLQKTVIISYR